MTIFNNNKVSVSEYLDVNFSPTTGDEFADALGVDSDEREIAISVRKVLACICKLNPNSIHPDARFGILVRSMKSGLLEGWDSFDFILRIERELHIKLSMEQIELPNVYQTDNASVRH